MTEFFPKERKSYFRLKENWLGPRRINRINPHINILSPFSRKNKTTKSQITGIKRSIILKGMTIKLKAVFSSATLSSILGSAEKELSTKKCSPSNHSNPGQNKELSDK